MPEASTLRLRSATKTLLPERLVLSGVEASRGPWGRIELRRGNDT